MESSKEEQQAILDRTSRPTRGKRMSKLLNEEADEDEAFWNQDALKEEENDDEYEDEGDVADEFDSDFDEDVSEADDEEQNEAEARAKDRPPKKRLMYTGKPPSKKKKDLSRLEDSLRTEMKKDVSLSDEAMDDDEKLPEQVTTPENAEDTDHDAEGEKTVRKSTRTAVIVRQAEREAIRAALQATTKPIKRKKEGEEKRMTQEEMLLEAAQTEIMNLRNLERVLAREEEVKKRAIVHKQVYTGPQIRYISKNGQSFFEFINGQSFDSELTTKAISYPERALCAVTGQPARYRDPKTGLPYATKEAFKILRDRYEAENNDKGKVASGDVYDSISGQGFLGKRKRSFVTHQNDISRDSRRFCQFRVPEILDSD